MERPPPARDVFINCPFDGAYQPIFRAIIFAVVDLGFVPRCALEVDDAGEVRLAKIVRIIGQCPYGIHDISAVGLTTGIDLPRFNMPLELGLYLGCKFFGTKPHRAKSSLILDSQPFRYRASISDIAGQDIHTHDATPEVAVREVRDWLSNSSKIKGLPGGLEIAERYLQLLGKLPDLCQPLKRQPDSLTFADYCEMVNIWLNSER